MGVGLQGLSSESKQVRFLLKTLVRHFNEDAECSPAHIGMMLYGLRSMSNSRTEVAAVLRLMVRLLMQSSLKPMTSLSVSSALFGLQNMHDSSAIRHLFVELGERLSQTSSALTGQEVGMCLQGLRGVGSESKSIRRLLEILSVHVSTSGNMSWSELCMSINGLQSMGGGKSLFSIETQRSNDMPYELATALRGSTLGTRKKNLLPPSLNGLLLGLADKAEETQRQEGAKHSYSAYSVASAVYGLQGLSADSSGVRRLLAALTHALQVATTYEQLEAQHVANTLFGLQNMTARAGQVRQLLQVVADGVRQSTCAINAQVVGNSLYGMQGFSSDVPEVRAVLRELAIKINEIQPTNAAGGIIRDNIFTGQNIGNALWGLRNMSTDHTEVRKILAVLAPHIRRSQADLTGQNLGNALYALNRMSDVFDEVREVLGALAFKLLRSTHELSGLDIGMALFGLRGMDASTPEVQVILGILLHKIKTSRSELQLSDLSLAIVGLLSSSNWIKDDFLKVLAARTTGMSLKVIGDGEGEGLIML
jgi:hypothetical protein